MVRVSFEKGCLWAWGRNGQKSVFSRKVKAAFSKFDILKKPRHSI
jgi:hypothetical protein